MTIDRADAITSVPRTFVVPLDGSDFAARAIPIAAELGGSLRRRPGARDRADHARRRGARRAAPMARGRSPRGAIGPGRGCRRGHGRSGGGSGRPAA